MSCGSGRARCRASRDRWSSSPAARAAWALPSRRSSPRAGANIVICGTRSRRFCTKPSSVCWPCAFRCWRCAATSRSATKPELLIQQATERFGRIDVLVNNAGQIAVGAIESQTIADFEEAMGTMFWGMVYTTMATLPQMREARQRDAS